jgi:hypothetical protein
MESLRKTLSERIVMRDNDESSAIFSGGEFINQWASFMLLLKKHVLSGV